MKKLNLYTATSLALALSLLSLPSYAGNIYRFLDKNGTSTLSKSLPPYAAQQGYEILDDKSFRVIERVPSRAEKIEQTKLEEAKLVEQEQLELKRQQEQEKQQQLRKQQQSRDQDLLDRYLTEDDLPKARAVELAFINKQIDDTTALKTSNQNKLHKLQQAAAEQELSGQAITNDLHQRISTIKKAINDNELHIDHLHNNKVISEHKFDDDLIRLRQLQGITDTP